MKKQLLLLIYILSCTAMSHAQQSKDPQPPSDHKVIIMGGGKDTKLQKKTITMGGVATQLHTRPTQHGMLKIALGDFLFGSSVLYYQHFFNDWFSVEAGAGLSFNALVKLSTILESSSTEFNDGSDYELSESPYWTPAKDITDTYTDYNIHKQTIGYQFSVVPKIRLYGDEDFSGWYIGPVLRYTRHNYLAQPVIEQTFDPNNYNPPVHTSDYSVNEYLNITDVGGVVSAQSVKDPFVFTIELMWSARFYSGLRQDIGIDDNNIYRNHLSNISFNGSHFEPSIRLGYRIY